MKFTRRDEDGVEPVSPIKQDEHEGDREYEVRKDNPYEDLGILGDIDFEPMDGDSSGGMGSMSFSDEQPEKLRDGSADGSSARAPSKRSSRMSFDSLEIPDTFNFDNEESAGRSSSLASSRRSKLSIVGEDPFGMDEESHNALFADSSLREEPESHPSLLKNHSQLPLSQRIPPFAMAMAQKVAEHLPDEDSSLSLFEIINPKSKSRRTAARVFYAMLVLQNEGVVRLDQEEPYEDLNILPTAQTQNYNLV